MSWEDNVRRVVPYVPGEQPANPDVIKLNTNENPYPPSPRVQQVLKDFEAGILRKYPDPDNGRLTAALSEAYGIPAENIFVGVGSDDVLAMSFLAFFNGKKPVLFPDITYSFYPVWCDLFGICYEKKALDESFGIRVEDYLVPNGGIVIANPNAPTGIAAEPEVMESIIHSNPDVVCIVDEAYVDFGGQSALPLVGKYDNLLVVRTFSKSRSLAGSRIGFAFGSRKLIQYLNDVKFSFNSYTMDAVTTQIGAAALSDTAYFEKTKEQIIHTREEVKVQLEALGFFVLPSATNFLFVTHPDHKAADLFSKLKENNIFVRYFNAPRIDQYLRITIGTDEEMRELLRVLEDYV